MEKTVAVQKLDPIAWDETIESLGEWSLKKDIVSYSDIKVSDAGFYSAGANFGIPESVMKEFGYELGVSVLRYLFNKRGEIAPVGLVRNGSIDTFVKHGTKFVSPFKVLDILYEAIPSADPNRIYVGEKAVEIYCLGKRVEKAIVGDPVQCGVYVAFSPFGFYAPDVTSFFNHLVCTNGMLSSRNFMTLKRARNDDDVYEWIRSSIETAYTSVDNEMARLIEMKSQKLNGNRDSVIAHMLSSIPNSARNLAMSELERFDRKIETAYDVYYFVTWFASHFLDNPKHIRALMLSAGDIPEHIDVCPTCHREI